MSDDTVRLLARLASEASVLSSSVTDSELQRSLHVYEDPLLLATDAARAAALASQHSLRLPFFFFTQIP